ncbi:MAG TPA: LOG family protein [Anaerolineaceae bacterium]|nr:LOG family protein [Anaerolineaceae bacterium]
MNVTVFGGAKPMPGDPAYLEAYHLGKLLAGAGYTVLTGGYIGTMEAVSRGANEAGGYVIGVTCDEIEKWRPGRANPWIREERRFPTLRERLFALIDHSEAAIALPGGAGTLTEISLVWNQLIIGSLPPRPLILVGPGWQAVFQAMFDNLGEHIHEPERSWLIFADTVEEAFNNLKEIKQLY